MPTTSVSSCLMDERYMPPQNVARVSSEPTSQQIKVFIIGHHDFSLDGLASMLAANGDGYTVSCIEPDDACMAKFVAAEPDALLIHDEVLQDPPERFIHTVTGQYPDIRIMVFGMNMDDDHLYRLVRAGVHGYINERMSGVQINRALDHVIAGNTWIERHIMERFITSQHNFDDALERQFNEKIDQLCLNLTKRETEILSEVVKGLAIKQIAEQVHLSHQGVKMHLAKLFKKFNVSNRNQLILAAFDNISPIEDLSVLLRNGLNKKLQRSDS